MRPFDYATPASLEEASALLAGTSVAPDGGAGAPTANGHAAPGDMDMAVKALAGGTDLLTLMKAEVAAPSLLVNVKALPELEAGIREAPDGLAIGALTTLAEIETSAVVRERYPALAEACALAATPQLRNMATLGGNLLQRPRCWYFRNHLFHCWLKGGDECQARDGENQQHAIFDQSPCVAVHPSDPPVALLALDASVALRGPRGERTVPLADFFAPPTEERRTETTLGDDELVVAVHLPTPHASARNAYLKAMDRKVWAFAMVSVAVSARVENGRVSACRLVLGGVANVPWRAERAEQALAGQAPDDALLGQAAEAALAGAQPLAHNAYKLPLARTLVRRALSAVLEA
jgi:xanthine dehydrogenase YagS FAD-binding subunit